MTRRLIETWLPIAALGEESVRERRSMTALPPTYYLHVWRATRPLVASRAAVLTSLLPEDADHDMFMRVLGIHGDPIASRRRIDAAKRKGERFEGEAYSYPPRLHLRPRPRGSRLDSGAVLAPWVERNQDIGPHGWWRIDRVRSRTSGPFRLRERSQPGGRFDRARNPGIPAAAWSGNGHRVSQACRHVSRSSGRTPLAFFPEEPPPNSIPTNFIWARTITCPHCDGLIPLSPNWRLAPDGTGVRLLPKLGRGRTRRGASRPSRLSPRLRISQQAP